MPGLEVKRVRKRAAIWLLALALLSSGQALAQAMETDEAGFAQCCRLLNWYPGEAWTLDGYQLADMNGDGVTDLVAVLRGQDGVSRRLVTAISTPEGYSLHENDRALPPESPQSPASEIDAQNGALVLRTRATGDTTRESTYTFVQNGDALVLGAMETVSWQEASGEAARECFDFSAGSYLQQSGLRNGSGFSVSETTAEYTFLPETLAFDAFDIASFPTTWDDFAGDAAVQPAQPTGTAAAAESDELAQDAPSSVRHAGNPSGMRPPSRRMCAWSTRRRAGCIATFAADGTKKARRSACTAARARTLRPRPRPRPRRPWPTPQTPKPPAADSLRGLRPDLPGRRGVPFPCLRLPSPGRAGLLRRMRPLL